MRKGLGRAYDQWNTSLVVCDTCIKHYVHKNKNKKNIKTKGYKHNKQTSNRHILHSAMFKYCNYIHISLSTITSVQMYINSLR